MIPLTEMPRIFYLYLAVATVVFGQATVPDDAFDRVPFEQWLNGGGGEMRLRWSAGIFHGVLSAHQRLATVFTVKVVGAEFVKRPAYGQLVVFLEIRDSDNRVFRTHRPMLFNVKNPSDLESVNFEQYAFVKPGDYRVAAAVYDAESKEHAIKQMKLHVAKLAHDPLPDSWRGLPDIEFRGVSDPPDRWFLPEIDTRLNLPVQTARPVRVEIVVNGSPTEMAMKRVGRVSSRNMGNLIPALKVLSQMDIKNGSINVTLLDVERRKVSFEQEAVRMLDWPRLRGALLDNDPNQIDVHALENHERNAQFFVSEIRKRLEGTETNGDVPLGLTAEPIRVVIVLSAPMAFSKGQDLRPIEATPEPGSRVFYIRYYPPRPGPQSALPPPGGSQRGRIPLPPPGAGRGATSVEDSLGRTLKPLAPRLFNVTTPMEFRSALAQIMSEISQLK